MSRIQAGAVAPEVRAVGLEEVVPAAVAGLDSRPGPSTSTSPRPLPPVLADPALLERAVANVVDNAARHSPPGRPVPVEAGAGGHRRHPRRRPRPRHPARGPRPGLPALPAPGRPPRRHGVGLGLAVAQGFLTAMGATIEIDDTPGGGFLSRPRARRAARRAGGGPPPARQSSTGGSSTVCWAGRRR